MPVVLVAAPETAKRFSEYAVPTAFAVQTFTGDAAALAEETFAGQAAAVVYWMSAEDADAVQALFLNAYRPGVHMALEGQFSKGCPGDVSGDSVLNREGDAPNAALVKDIHFPVH